MSLDFSRRPCLLLALLVASTPANAAPSSGAFGKGSIRGTVKALGKPPAVDSFDVPDRSCPNPVKVVDALVGPNGGLKNVLVRVTAGVAGSYPPPGVDATLDQVGCQYQPRVQAIFAGQALKIRNSDSTLHNVHVYRDATTLLNQAEIPGMLPIRVDGARLRGDPIVKFKCDVHPWMTAYVAVVNNPFFAVTGEDGSFTIDKLPPGSYTIEAWHERAGTKTVANVKVTEGTPAVLSIQLALP